MHRPGLLKAAIALSGHTQREVADHVGIDETKLSRIVNGRQHADDATRAAIADKVGRTVEDLWPSEQAAA